MPVKRKIYEFKVTLLDTKPAIWRRIQVPETYTFWDLHVAIQDSMGWLDCHLHAFRFGKGRPRWEIGIPDDDGFDDLRILPGWEVPISEYFDVGTECLYEYDFGDSWVHALTLEGMLLAKKGQRYPVCLEGERACPPEDCGGVGGYYRLLEILSDPTHEEYDEFIAWLGGTHDPISFDPTKVKFDNPKKRWKSAFSGGI
jgi:hypothetical protein